MDIVTETIKSYFESEEWKYDLESDDDNTCHSFYTVFNGRNEKLLFKIMVLPNSKICQIICQSETKFSPEYQYGASLAINEYNSYAPLVCGCVSEKGDITFWLGRNTDGDTFSKEAFAADFDTVFKVTDNETAQILKRAIQLTPTETSKGGTGLFSFFKRK